MESHVWMFIAVCVCVRTYALMHVCCMQSCRVTERGTARWLKTDTHVSEDQRVKTNLRSRLHFHRGGAGTLFLSIQISLSLSSVSAAFVLLLRHHSHLMLSRSLSLPSCSLCVYLSPLMRRFLIKSSLYRETLLWW